MNNKSHLLQASALALVSTLSFHANAAPLLSATAGAIAGFSNLTNNCNTYGPSSQISSFTSKLGGVPIGGISNCGFTGSYVTNTGTSGTVAQSNSVGPTLLGIPGFTGSYSGTAASTASFGTLGVRVDGAITGGTPGSPSSKFETTGAATFSDRLTVTSSGAVNGTTGTVRYLIGLTGSETTPPVLVSNGFGETYALVELTHSTLQPRQVVNVSDRPGSLGLISNQTPPAGWTTVPGSIRGSSVFGTPAFSFTWGSSFDFALGLLAWQSGTSTTDFSSGVKLTGFEFFNSSGQAVSAFSVTADSGTDYINGGTVIPPNNNVPTPSSAGLLLIGAVAFSRFLKKKHSGV
jgi:hypothetical protein